MQLSYFDTGKVNWETSIRDYAKEMDMSFAAAMDFLSTRPNLNVAVEFLGIEASNKVLTQLGRFIESKGYHVPMASSYSMVTREQGAKRLVKRSTFDLTKEQYLEMRNQGLLRKQICQKLKINAGSLYFKLDQWGIKEVDKEQEAMKAMQNGQVLAEPTAVETPNSIDVSMRLVQELSDKNISSEYSQGVDKTVDNSVDNHVDNSDTNPKEEYVTIRIPLRFEGAPAEQPRYSRDELIEQGMKHLQAAAAWAYKEMLDLLGDEATVERVQGFIDRKVGTLS